MNTLNYKINNNIYNTHYYIKKTDVGLGVDASRSNMRLGVDASPLQRGVGRGHVQAKRGIGRGRSRV